MQRKPQYNSIMKTLIFSALLSLTSTSLMAQVTTLKTIVDEISKLHNGDEVMEVMESEADFVGFKIPFFKGVGQVLDQFSAEDGNDWYFKASHNHFGKYENDYRKHPHFSEKKVNNVIKKLEKKCKKYIKEIMKQGNPLGEEYYCSKVYVYTTDIKNPEVEGLYSKAEGQIRFTNQEQKPGTASPSKTRRALPSNNELMANYDVYTIALMRK